MTLSLEPSKDKLLPNVNLRTSEIILTCASFGGVELNRVWDTEQCLG